MIRTTFIGFVWCCLGFGQAWETLHLPTKPITKVQIESAKALYIKAIKNRPLYEDPALRLKAAAEAGYPLAQYEIYYYRVTRALPAEALPESVQAKKQAQHNLVECYKNIIEQAESGDIDCIMKVGDAADTLARRTHSGMTFHDVNKIRIYWLRRAVKAGHPEAPLQLALTLFHSGASQAEKLEGFELLKGQAIGGNCISLNLLCNAYVYGKPDIGLKQDLSKAQYWIDLLAKFCGEDASNFPIKPHYDK